MITTEPHPVSATGRRRRRRWPLWLAATALGVAAGAAATVITESGRRPAAAPHPATTTAPIVRTDLAGHEQEDGTLGYGTARGVLARRPGGTLTWLPEAGRTVRRGERLFSVDGHRVPLFYGAAPLWRTLEEGVSDGADVKLVERNLRALGCDDGLTVDREFTWRTADAIECWQDKIGVTQTGRLDPGDVAVESGAVRVSSVDATPGGAATGTVLHVTDAARIVHVDLPVDRQRLAAPHAGVSIELPGGKTTTGHVSRVGTVATAQSGQNGSGGSNGSGGQGGGGNQPGTATADATIPVDVTLDHPRDSGRLDGAPVTVTFTGERRKDVLAVPVGALLARSDGRYAVEVVDASGRRRTVPVQLGMFADGQVEVTGPGLAAGMRVEVPSS